MKVFTLPPQPDATLDEIKSASLALAREHGHVEEGDGAKRNGEVARPDGRQAKPPTGRAQTTRARKRP